MNPNLKTGKQMRFLVRRLPATVSGVLMLVISVVSANSFSQLKVANFWREHTYEVLTEAQTFLVDLYRMGYHADLARDGLQALKAAEEATYDLILMDIQMPHMTGTEAARLIREKLGATSPIIFALTADALEGDKQRFLDLGFDGYLSKPLQVQTLQETLITIKSSAGSLPLHVVDVG
jgi:CheY-like chemotaxis protein